MLAFSFSSSFHSLLNTICSKHFASLPITAIFKKSYPLVFMKRGMRGGSFGLWETNTLSASWNDLALSWSLIKVSKYLRKAFKRSLTLAKINSNIRFIPKKKQRFFIFLLRLENLIGYLWHYLLNLFSWCARENF